MLANFYRNLEAKHPSLAEAFVSKESLIFLGQTGILSIPVIANINRAVLNGFIVVLGAAAIATATAFILSGISGLITTSIAATMAAVGFFATDRYQNQQLTDNVLCFSQCCWN